VLIVEDHPMMRIGIRSLLDRSEHFTVCAECPNSRTALAQLRGDQPDMVILDITLPGGLDGIELIKCMVSEHSGVGILVFSVHDEALYALRSIAAGAKGYLMKGADPKAVLKALQTIRDGGVAVSPGISQRLVQRAVGHNSTACSQTTGHLSDRELEVLSLIGRGSSTQQIATSLGISTKTVETHRAHLKQKLALKGAFELFRYAVAWRFSEGHAHPATGLDIGTEATDIRGASHATQSAHASSTLDPQPVENVLPQQPPHAEQPRQTINEAFAEADRG
jgi:DNA-binding NarL/FixJ family response regulator